MLPKGCVVCVEVGDRWSCLQLSLPRTTPRLFAHLLCVFWLVAVSPASERRTQRLCSEMLT